jgi:LacI family transcriptional regulator
MRHQKAPTLNDVAREAGVSPYTVSVVLNGARSNTRVSEATRRRIVESAAALRYHPNAVARGLAKRRTNTLGVLFSVVDPTTALTNAYASGLLQGVVTHAASRGFDVLLYTELWKGAERSAARFRDRRADGVIVAAPLTDTDILPALAALDLPLVAISPAPDARPAAIPAVDVDNERGIRLAVEHLVALGHRRIAHLTGDANVASVPLRRAAFERAMAAAGLPVPPGYVVPCTYDGGTVGEVVPGLLALPEPPTAVVAGNDNLAIATLAAARALGVDVPGGLSVVGFDDNPAAAQVTPALTTVRQPLLAIGGEAARLLIDRIEGKEEVTGGLTLSAPELIVRASTGAPRCK